jgi:hypothetical protein
MKIELIGVAADRRRLRQLCNKLGQLDANCNFTFVPVSKRFDPETQSNVTRYYCWTKASVGSQGTLLQAHAVTAKRSGLPYLGLICDDVTVPAEVAGAQDLTLPELEHIADLDIGKLQDVLVQLKRLGTARENSTGTQLGRLADQVEQLVRLIRRNRVYKAVAATVLIIGALAGLMPVAEYLRARPSEEEAKSWEAIVETSNCQNFDRFYARYGPDSKLSKLADHRLKSKQTILRDQPMSEDLPVFVTTEANRRFKTEASAYENFVERWRTLGNAQCRMYAKGYARSNGNALLVGDYPNCTNYGGSYRCSGAVAIRCPFIEQVPRETCPPSSKQ